MRHSPASQAAHASRQCAAAARRGRTRTHCNAPGDARGGGVTVSTVQSLSSFSQSEWDACAGSKNPFVSYSFLRALEDSGSVGAQAGWLPLHLAARDAAGRLVGAAPCYAKGHSQGEYVFDQSWAAAYARNGLDYYPKLQVASPFSPVTGPRLLCAADAPVGTFAALAEGLKETVEKLGLSSAHVTFLPREEAAQLQAQGWCIRAGMQYHWLNRGYTSFADFEAALVQKKRKAVRQERKKAREGMRIRRLRGGEVTPAMWDAFYGFYTDTVDRKWGTAYLTRDFFQLLGETAGDSVLLVVAEEEEPAGGGGIVAGALNLVGGDALYGRNWGARGAFQLLHFELCYYQAIEEAIACGLARVEAGAQGEHKLSRGYLRARTMRQLGRRASHTCAPATATFSAHHIGLPPFRTAISDFVALEKAELTSVAEAMHASENPYREAASQFDASSEPTLI